MLRRYCADMRLDFEFRVFVSGRPTAISQFRFVLFFIMFDLMFFMCAAWCKSQVRSLLSLCALDSLAFTHSGENHGFLFIGM